MKQAAADLTGDQRSDELDEIAASLSTILAAIDGVAGTQLQLTAAVRRVERILEELRREK